MEKRHRDSWQVLRGSKSNSGQLLLFRFMHNRKHYFKDQETPRNVLCPPHSLEFYYEHDGRTFDGGDSSTEVAKLCDMEMINRSVKRGKQGAAIRYLPKWSFDPTSLGRNSVQRRMLFGLTNAHTRFMRKSRPYAVLHEMKRSRDMITAYHPSSMQTTCMWCHFCAQPWYGRGNTRHLHVFCEDKNLKAMRQVCYGIRERKLEEIVSTAEVIRCSNANMAHTCSTLREDTCGRMS